MTHVQHRESARARARARERDRDRDRDLSPDLDFTQREEAMTPVQHHTHEPNGGEREIGRVSE
jgi:hypothetical protein